MEDANVKKFVAGFLFTPDRQCVALIRKNRPSWQAGKLNGIGGKIEPGEGSLAAMIREFREETGAEVKNWNLFCEVNWETGVDSSEQGFVHFFVACGDIVIKSTTDEEVSWYYPNSVESHPCVDNLSWLIPMAMIALDRPKMFANVELS